MKASYSAYCSHLWTKLPTKDRKTKVLGIQLMHECCTGDGWAPIPFYQSSCSFPTMFKSPFSTVPIPFSLNSLSLLQLPPFHPSVNTFFLLQFSFSLLFQAPYSLIPALSLPISRRFWEWGCPNHGDVHITVTPLVSTLSFLMYTFLFPSSLSFLSYFLSFYSHGYHPAPPPSPCLFLRHWYGCYCHRFLKFPVFSEKKINVSWSTELKISQISPDNGLQTPVQAVSLYPFISAFSKSQIDNVMWLKDWFSWKPSISL